MSIRGELRRKAIRDKKRRWMQIREELGCPDCGLLIQEENHEMEIKYLLVKLQALPDNLYSRDSYPEDGVYWVEESDGWLSLVLVELTGVQKLPITSSIKAIRGLAHWLSLADEGESDE